MSFETPTEIQQQAIPLALAKKDIIAGAQTGTGKTAAFGIPVLSQLIENPEATALILAPTRELAMQILDVIRKLSSHTPHMTVTMLIGGSNMQGQIRSLKKHPRIIVATPGRLVDHLQQKNVTLQTVSFLVLDEADRMMDMGFAPQLEAILKYLPKERQTMFFSATIPPNIEALSKKYLHQPVRVIVGPINQKVEKIEQEVIETTNQKKNDLLLDQLNAREGSVLIFTRTKDRTERLANYLLSYGYSVTRIHGGRTQGQRNTAIKLFREGKFRILVATDVVARGLDIPHIAHVINYDLPQSPEDYIHRVGRTARAGAGGKALCLLVPDDKYQWIRINKLYNPDVAEEPARRHRSDGSHRDRPRAARPNKFGKQKARDGRKSKPSFFTRDPESLEVFGKEKSTFRSASGKSNHSQNSQRNDAKKTKSAKKKKSSVKKEDSFFSKKFGRKKRFR